MRVPSVLLTTYALSSLAHAFRLPFGFHLPWASAYLNGNQLPLLLPSDAELNDQAADVDAPNSRIAIIGAGAGGSAAAFWIGKAKERWGLDVEIDVFEERDYVGGRSTTVYPYDDPRLEPVELGASIFVEANKNMWRATDEFGFTRADFEEGDDTVGLWDGKEFVLTTASGTWSSWWTTIKVLWRYGFQAPRRTQALVKEMITHFLTLYTPAIGTTPWTNLTTLASGMGWTDLVSSTTMDYLDAQGINGRFTREIVEGATRVNYGQNTDAIHALEGFCSLAADKASQVAGGNWQIFEQFVKRSNATLYLNTTVISITQKSEDKYILHTTSTSTSQDSTRAYRAVILAAPFHSTGLRIHTLSPSALPVIPPQPYVHLHVTLISTPNPHARTRYFGLKPDGYVPGMVLTTWERARAGEEDALPEFNSLSYHGKVRMRYEEEGTDVKETGKKISGRGPAANLTELGVGEAKGRDESGEEWLSKVFSDHRLDDSWLRKAYGKLGWVHRKEWDAYPVLPPATDFPPIKLAKGLYYVNAFEPFISTMETETLSARNVVELLMQEEFEASICKTDPSSNSTVVDEKEDFVYGWDC